MPISDEGLKLLQAVRAYWNARAEGFSLRTLDELASPAAALWRQRFFEWLPNPQDPFEVDLPGKLLDVGCGPGIFTIIAAQCGWDAAGLDLSPEMTRQAAANAQPLVKDAPGRTSFRTGSADALPFEDDAFHAVVSRNLLWNLSQPMKALAEMKRVLKPGGILLIADGCHYKHFTDPAYRRLRELAGPGESHQPQYMKGADPSVMDEIAKTLPLSGKDRPEWDVAALKALGMKDARCVLQIESEAFDHDAGRQIRLPADFVVLARKPDAG